MIKRIKEVIKENKERQKKIIAQNEELLWANVFHDSIRGKKAIEDLPLNIGRWAGNYSFFYVLNRILNDYQPKRILEFGLGESSKFVSVYLDNYLINSEHLIIEQDDNWRITFENKFVLSLRSLIKVLPLIKKKYKECDFNGYENIENTITSAFDLYLIDGPFGSSNYSRFDIFTLVQKLSNKDEFIILIDDYDRHGEKQTVNELLKMFKNKEMNVFTATYTGMKDVIVIGTEKYKYITSL
ncbi:hypothetical protein [Flavobacterium sp. SLB02]|uniref:hypothetical protein n=1 Tax=Flavobacterium sp. SLB02 TaxID=2665645 RepID=UPI0012A7F0B7|nr:hypothetical protein [Flavobacterium sp. SLB02]QGK76870.1 hypothetical protein GIY83_23185 [Flavobacterium sp. SLB02]